MVGKEWVEGCGQRIRSVKGIGVSPMPFFMGGDAPVSLVWSSAAVRGTEMVEGGIAVGYRAALRAHQAQAGLGLHVADACDRRATGQCRCGHRSAPGHRGGEGQFVVVATGEGALVE